MLTFIFSMQLNNFIITMKSYIFKQLSGHFCGGVPSLWINCAEIVFAAAQPLGILIY